MRALLGICWDRIKPALLASCCLFLAAAGCTWGSRNGVPWYGSTADHKDADADVAHYGPFARDRIATVKQFGEYAAEEGTADDKQRVAERLATDIVREGDPSVRVQMVRTLATIPNETAANVLVMGMKDPDPEVRVAVCQGWGIRVQANGSQGMPPSTRDNAVRILGGCWPATRISMFRLMAARQLGHVKGDNRAVGALGLALKDPDPALQVRTVASLQESSGQNLGSDVAKWQQYVDSVAPAGYSPQNAGEPQLATPLGPAQNRR